MEQHERDLIDWNRGRHSPADIKRVQTALGAAPDGVWGMETQTAVEIWQFDHGLEPDGKVGSKTMAAMLADDGTSGAQPVWKELTDEEVDGIIALTVEVESGGRKDPYTALNLDAEYEGWFDKPKRNAEGRKLRPAERAELPNHRPHSCSKYGDEPCHIAISVGIIQFTLDGGSLGHVLDAAHDKDSSGYMEPWDGHGAELLDVATTSGGSGFGRTPNLLRGPRVKPVGGHDLWKGPWPDRWRRAMKMELFRWAQRKVAREEYFDPALDICKDYEHDSQAALAVAFDMAVQYGANGARRRFRAAGKGAHILDVIDEIDDARGRERRHEIVAHCETWVHYEDLVMC